MSKAIATTGAIRAFLAQTLEDLRSGKMDVATAREIAKSAGQLHKSMETEVKVMRAMVEAGQTPPAFGSLEVGEKE